MFFHNFDILNSPHSKDNEVRCKHPLAHICDQHNLKLIEKNINLTERIRIVNGKHVLFKIRNVNDENNNKNCIFTVKLYQANIIEWTDVFIFITNIDGSCFVVQKNKVLQNEMLCFNGTDYIMKHLTIPTGQPKKRHCA